MGNIPMDALQQAVELLATGEDVADHYQALQATLKLARIYPVRLHGAASALNPLLELGLRAPEAYDRVLGLVESKRAAADLPPLESPKDDRFDKTEYMRGFMDQKRQRQRRAASIENLVRPERDRLIGRARLDFMDAQAARWKAELDRRVEHARQVAGGRIPRENLDALRNQFWAGVDAELDELERKARGPRR